MDYLGAGKPILAALEGEQAEILRRYRAGCAVGSGDEIGLGKLVEQAAANPEAFKPMGERGRKLVNERLLLPSILERYANLIEAAAARQLDFTAVWEPAL